MICFFLCSFFVLTLLQDTSSAQGLQSGPYSWPSPGESISHGHNRVSHQNVAHYPQSQQHQQQLSQPSGVPMSAWDHAGQGRGALAVADPWGRPFSSGGENDSDQSLMNGSASWSHGSAQQSALNGWGGAPNRNFQQHQQHVDHRISQYVIGLPAEIINQARLLTPTPSARCMLCLALALFLLFRSALLLSCPRSQIQAGSDYGQYIHAPKRCLVCNELWEHRLFRRRTAQNIHIALSGSSFVARVCLLCFKEFVRTTFS